MATTSRRRVKSERDGGAQVTLHARAYVDPEVLERERREVFARAWMMIGHSAEVAEPGDFTTGSIAGEPVVVVRDHDGRLRAFSNVCRHRAARLADGNGSCGKVLRCPYHGWTYRLDGSLAAMPEGRGFGRDFDRDAVRLPEFAVGELGGLVFVSMDPNAMPLRDWFGDIAERIESLGIDQLVPIRRLRFDRHAMRESLPGIVRARDPRRLRDLLPESESGRWYAEYPHNWKVIADNYLEGYHIPVGHPGLLRLLDYPKYRATLY